MRPRGANGRYLGEAHTSIPCEQCGVAFWRRGKASYMGHRDAFRFCSKRCWGAWTAALAAPDRQRREQARQVERTLTQVITAELQRTFAALDLPTTRGKRREAHRCPRVPHVCPDCGATFHAPARRVYCSPQCARRYYRQARRGRYPSLTRTPIVERNQLASLLSNVRAVQRLLHGA
jgi:hypothetical protein